MNQLSTIGRNDSSAVTMLWNDSRSITSTKSDDIHTATLKSSFMTSTRLLQ